MSAATIYHKRTEAAKGIIWALIALFGLFLLVLLYSLKSMALDARKDIRQLQADILQEENAVQLLKAEIVYLERPDRLSELSQQSLGLEPIRYQDLVSLEGLKNIPFRADFKDKAAP